MKSLGHVINNTCSASRFHPSGRAYARIFFPKVCLNPAGAFSLQTQEVLTRPQNMTLRLEHILKMFPSLSEHRDNGLWLGVGVLSSCLTFGLLRDVYGGYPGLSQLLSGCGEGGTHIGKQKLSQAALPMTACLKIHHRDAGICSRLGVKELSRLCFLLSPSKCWSEELNYSRRPARV